MSTHAGSPRSPCQRKSGISLACMLALAPLAAIAQHAGHDLSRQPSNARPVDPGQDTEHCRDSDADNPSTHAGHGVSKQCDTGTGEAGTKHPEEHAHILDANEARMQGMAPASMGMDEMPMQDNATPAGTRDPDYSDGIAHSPMSGMGMGDTRLGHVMLDQFEYRHAGGLALDAQAWYGGDLNKLWLKLGGERHVRSPGTVRVEALWSHAVASYWDAQSGWRHDSGGGPARDWLAVGLQGVAPYWFYVEATAYLGTSGRAALRLSAEYELRFTQRLILQPDLELNLYGRDDPARSIGAGLSDIETGLRLRYEVARKFAPYVGIVHSRAYARTAELRRLHGEHIVDTQLVVGIHAWF